MKGMLCMQTMTWQLGVVMTTDGITSVWGKGSGSFIWHQTSIY